MSAEESSMSAEPVLVDPKVARHLHRLLADMVEEAQRPDWGQIDREVTYALDAFARGDPVGVTHAASSLDELSRRSRRGHRVPPEDEVTELSSPIRERMVLLMTHLVSPTTSSHPDGHGVPEKSNRDERSVLDEP